MVLPGDLTYVNVRFTLTGVVRAILTNHGREEETGAEHRKS